MSPARRGNACSTSGYAGSLDAVASAIGRACGRGRERPDRVHTRMETQLDSAKWPVRAITTLLTIFAIGSLLIAVIGQYAVVPEISPNVSRHQPAAVFGSPFL